MARKHSGKGRGGRGVKRFHSIVRSMLVPVLITGSLGTSAACTKVPKPDQIRPSASGITAPVDLKTQLGLPDILRVAVFDDQPGMGWLRNGKPAGFDVDVARWIADELGYHSANQITFTPVENDIDRLNFLISGKVDLVVASFSITEERKKLIRFAGPYIVTEQRVMIRRDSPEKIRSISDLQRLGKKLCAVTGSTSDDLLRKRGISSELLNTDSLCFQGMKSRQFVAMVTDETLLEGYRSTASEGAEYELPNITLGMEGTWGIEELGIGVPMGKPAVQAAVQKILAKSYAEQEQGKHTRWQQILRANLSSFTTTTQPQPHEL
jgi:glutamate transport system substrate-binding protein